MRWTRLERLMKCLNKYFCKSTSPDFVSRGDLRSRALDHNIQFSNNRMDLYAENIMEHHKHPDHFGHVKGANAKANLANPLCGDKLSVELKIGNTPKKIIEDAKFSGVGCAISRAGADMLMDHIIGKSVEEVKNYSAEEVYELFGVEITPARTKCALLALTAVKKALE